MVTKVLSNYANGHWSHFVMVIVTQISKRYTNTQLVKKIKIKSYMAPISANVSPNNIIY